MSEKIKLNKNALREQKQSLALYQEFLPTLELRKQQLQVEVRNLRKELQAKHEEMDAHFAEARKWAPLIEGSLPAVRPLVDIKEVVSREGNVAGVKVPVFESVDFEITSYSLTATEPYIDDAVNFWKGAIAFREQLKLMERQMELLNHELRKTTQRINLYEKVMIPQAKENIRRIKVYLGDQQTAAVCRAKMAKEKLVKKAQAASVG